MHDAGIDGVTTVSALDLKLRYRRGGGVGPLTFSIQRGEVLGLAGGNGAGKTTLLRLICGLVSPHAGEVRVWGAPVLAGTPPPSLGAMIEEPPFYDFLTGRQNLELAAAGRGKWLEHIDLCLSTVQLSAGDQRVAEYSQGMRQRLGLARALLGDPRLLILDEPANGLDPPGIRWLRQFLRHQADRGVTVVISSHLLGELGRSVDTALILRSGDLIATLDSSAISASATAIEDAYFGDTQ